MRHFYATLLIALTASAPAIALGAEDGDDPAAPASQKRPSTEVLSDGAILRLTLEEAVSLALRNNLDLRASSFSPAISETSLLEARTLYDHLFTARVDGSDRRFPVPGAGGVVDTLDEDSLSGSVSVERLLPTGGVVSLEASSDRALTNSTFATLDPRWDSSLTLVFRQPLLRGRGRDYTEAGVRFAENNKDLVDFDFRSRTESLVLNVESTYWSLVNARGQVEVQRKSLDVALDLLRIADARLKAGAGTKVDVSQAGAGVALREVDLLRAENDMRSVAERLLGIVRPRTISGVEGDLLAVEPADDPAQDLPGIPLEDMAAAVEIALLRRSDVRAQKVQSAQSGITVMRARSDALSRLDLSASVGYGGVAGNLGQAWSRSAASREYGSWSVGLFFQVPIGNRAAEARLHRALLQQSQSEAQVRALENNVIVSVRNARRDLESTRLQIDAAARATSLAEEQLVAERERLRADKSTTFEVLRLEEDLTQARLSELRALVEFRVAVAAYDFQTGRILEQRGLAPPPAPETLK
jgi:outer membrane protein TolC